MKRLLGLVLTLSFGSACATWFNGHFPTSQGYGRMMASWVGSSTDDLVRTWGPPSTTYALESGHQLYLYRSDTGHLRDGEVVTRNDPATHQRTTRYAPPSVWVSSCTSQFELAEGRVVSWRYEGADCKALYDGSAAAARPDVAWLGVSLGTVTPEVAHRLGLQEAQGVLVLGISAASPAQDSGLRVLDVVTALNGARANSVAHLQQLIASRQKGEVVELEVLREGGAPLALRARLGEKPR